MLILIPMYIILPAVQLYFFLNAQYFGFGIADALNYGASIFALHWLLSNVILSAKIPWLQSIIPYDARIRFHIYSTAGIAIAVLYHSIYKFALDISMDPVTWILMGILVLMISFALLWIPVPGFRIFRNKLVQGIKGGKEVNYDRSKNLHKLFVLIIGGVLLLHIIGAELFSDVNTFSTILYILFYGGSFSLYILSLTGAFRIKAEILSIEENQGILTVKLQPKRRIHYKSGQFTFLGSQVGNGIKEEHPFSFLSFPEKGEKTRKGMEPVSLAVRAMGDFTRGLTSLKNGDMIQLRGAYGNFRPGKEDNLCFVASGIGTVPIISILKELHSKGDKRKIHLFLAVNHEDEIPEKENIIKIASSMANLDFHLMVFNKDGLRYSEELFIKALDDHGIFSYYICSSPPVRTIVVDALKNLGVKKSKIHYETFSFA